MEKTGIIFDLDGTLWDSSRQVAASWNEVLARFPEWKLSVTQEDIRGVCGMPMDAIARRLFSGLNEEQQMALLAACEANENRYVEEHGGQLFPGTEETLRILSAEYPLFIMSNCQIGYIDAFLKHYGFEPYFSDQLCFGDNRQSKAYNIREIARRNGITHYYYVGDIQADYDATVAAGGQFIHAAYGFGTVREEVPVIRALTGLPEMMRKLQNSTDEKDTRTESRFTA